MIICSVELRKKPHIQKNILNAKCVIITNLDKRKEKLHLVEGREKLSIN